jgi:hypothetical protein
MSELQQRLHELFEYRDGDLYWKVDRGSQKCKGKKAGTPTSKGYLAFRVRELGGSMLVHRAVWIMQHGEAPDRLDHINGNPLDNRIENLRPASRSQNGYNRPVAAHNTSGVKNVSWCKTKNKWSVTVSVSGKKKWFGYYNDIELAEMVATEVRNKYHGEFACHRSL